MGRKRERSEFAADESLSLLRKRVREFLMDVWRTSLPIEDSNYKSPHLNNLNPRNDEVNMIRLKRYLEEKNCTLIDVFAYDRGSIAERWIIALVSRQGVIEGIKTYLQEARETTDIDKDKERMAEIRTIRAGVCIGSWMSYWVRGEWVSDWMD
mmetsp:Transcript_25109/g.41592  ORF Transcript_25109/g.41592 Transcript_25109/m.41592 type:complete len:153 (+) Transcript_25109:147-605(+)